MISFVSLHFFIYCPSRFLSSREKKKSLCVTNLTHVTRATSIEIGAQFCLIRCRTEGDNGMGLTGKQFLATLRAFLWLPVFSNNNSTEVSGKVFLSTSNGTKPLGGRGSAQDPNEELTAIPQTPYVVGGGRCPPRTPALLSALQASNLKVPSATRLCPLPQVKILNMPLATVMMLCRFSKMAAICFC